MAAVYVDTSALARVLLGEPDSAAIVDALRAFEQRVASRLMRVELHRVALRDGLAADADALLSGIALLPVDDDVLVIAETLPPKTVATLDAIHLATAVRLSRSGRLDTVMTYDGRLAAGARHHGMTVLSPA